MSITAQNVQQSRLARNVEYKNLVEEHSWCESQLHRLLQQSYVTPEDFIQEAILERLKLRLKDQIDLIVKSNQQESLQS